MQLTETQTQIRDTARRFAEREITPHAADWDRAAETPRALYTKMAKAGLIGITVAPEHGGAGADFLSYALAIEEIAAADGGVSNVMAATNSPVAVAVEEKVPTSKKATISPESLKATGSDASFSLNHIPDRMQRRYARGPIGTAIISC